MPARTGEDWSAGISASFAEPWAQGRHGVAGQRDGPFLTSLAEDLDVRAAAEGDVGVAHCRQLRDPQAGLHGEGEQGPVAPPCPAPGAGRLQQRIGLVRLQEADERASRRLDGIASTRAMSAACSGWRCAAKANHERSATSLALRVATLTPRCFSRWVRNPLIVVASRSSKPSSAGCFPLVLAI